MAYTDREDLNYLGQLALIGANQTPLLNMLGGLSGGTYRTSQSFIFPVAQPYSLSAGSQPEITETDSVTSGTATTVTRDQDLNTVQIFQKTVEVSKAKQSTVGEISGLSAVGVQPVQDEFGFQKDAALRQIAVDLEFSMLNGVYAAASNATTAAKMKGLANAISTNAVAAGGAALDKALMDSMFQTMAASGALFENVVIFCNAFQKTKISDIYGYAPTDRNVGGVNVKQIETDFGVVGVMYDPQVATDDVYAVEMSVMSLMFVPTEGQLIIFEDLAKIAASKKGEWYAQIGLDYGAEEYHGALTGLATE
jgi:hypothetical protein